MSDTKRKISAWVPAALYDEVEKAGYTSPTIAVTRALELLVKAESIDELETSGDNSETIWRQMETERDSLKDEVERLNISLRASPDPGEFSRFQARSEELERQMKFMEENLRKAPDPIEFAQLRTRSEDKDKQIEEKERHIETLKAELEQAHEDKDNIQNLYDNYMRQMQTLIQQKAIESPGAKKWWEFWK